MSEPITFFVGPLNGGRPQRVAVAQRGAVEFRESLDPNSSRSRRQFVSKLVERFGLPAGDHEQIEDDLLRAADAADTQALETQDDRQSGGDKERNSEILLRLADGAELFANEHNQAFATIRIDDHSETWPIRSRGFKGWITRLFFEETGRPPGSQTLQDVLGVLEARAAHSGERQTTSLRVAGDGDDIYLDLGDAAWRAVKITRLGWEVVNEAPCKFRRSRTMAPMATPERGGRLDDLWQFVNAAEHDRPLLLAWLVAAKRPTGPYPLLVFQAEQGSGKSTSSRVLRSLIDPSSLPLRSSPRDPRDLMIAATNNHVLAFDNLSSVEPWLSDGLCRLSTGGGFATRELWTDGEEAVFDACRPVIINGITELANRADLLDRSLLVGLPRIDDARRRTEADFWSHFDKAQPRLLGALLDAVVGALRRLPDVRLPTMPRMADFASWATAAEPAMGLAHGAFMSAYSGNRDQGNELALESSPVANAIRLMMANHDEWLGSASELLTDLEQVATVQDRRSRAWPADATRLAVQLQRVATNLRAVGIDVEYGRKPGGGRKRFWRLVRTMADSSVPSVPSVPTEQKPRENDVPPGTLRDADHLARDAAGVEKPREGTPGTLRDAEIHPDSNGRTHHTFKPEAEDVNALFAEAAAEDGAE